MRITVETCPHYLTFAAEDVPDGATAFKCCPPIREASHREALWAALADGDVDLVVSDHSPCTPDLKRLDVGDFGAAWGGIASLQVALPVVWTGARARGIGAGRVVRWMSAAPARLAGLPGKGAIAVGKDADLVAFAPEERWTVGDLRAPQPGDALRGARAARRRPADLAARASRPAAGPSAGCSRAAACQSEARPVVPRSSMTDFTRLPDLACRALGGAVVAANDESFAERENLVRPEPPVARTEFGHKGKVYDGWETRRRRTPGHDWAVVRLGAPGDRARASSSTPRSSPATTRRTPRSTAPRSRGTARSTSCSRPTGSRCSPLSGLAGDTPTPSRWSPTAGSPTCGSTSIPTAGSPGCACTATSVPDPRLARRRPVRPGGAGERRLVTGVSNEFYGRPQQLVAPGLARDMGEGWETARRRDARQRLGGGAAGLRGRGHPRRARHHAGSCTTRPARRRSPGSGPDGEVVLLPRTRLQPDTRHRFVLDAAAGVDQVRLDVFPDGGMARLRLWGRPDRRRPGGARPALVRRAARRPGAGGARLGRRAAAGGRPPGRAPAADGRAAARGGAAGRRTGRLTGRARTGAAAAAPPLGSAASHPLPEESARVPPLSPAARRSAARRSGWRAAGPAPLAADTVAEGAADALEAAGRRPARRRVPRRPRGRGRRGDRAARSPLDDDPTEYGGHGHRHSVEGDTANFDVEVGDDPAVAGPPSTTSAGCGGWRTPRTPTC